MKKAFRTLVNILIILTLVVGTITIMQASITVVETSAQLLNDNSLVERQEMNDSDNVVIKLFDNSNAVIKILLLIWALISFVLIPYMWIVLIIKEGSRIIKKVKMPKIRLRKRDA